MIKTNITSRRWVNTMSLLTWCAKNTPSFLQIFLQNAWIASHHEETPDWNTQVEGHAKEWKACTFSNNVKVRKVRKSLRNYSLLKETEGTGEQNTIHNPRLDPELERKRNTERTAGGICIESLKEHSKS